LLIKAGVQVTIFNQRSVDEIFSMLYQVAAMVGEAELGLAKLSVMRAELEAIRSKAASFKRRPKVFFEEWDEPHISGIRWVSELMGLAGGDDVFPELAVQSLGKDRIIADSQTIIDRAPDIIIGSWCGKKFRSEKVANRPGWQDVPAVRNGQLFEIKSADILQPGPAALMDGVAQLHKIFSQWADRHA
jgi:iron complex transport system substrate-binding protein